MNLGKNLGKTHSYYRQRAQPWHSPASEACPYDHVFYLALETWWLTPISLMDGNVGPEQRTYRNGIDREDAQYAHLGLRGRHRQGPGVAVRTLSKYSWLHGHGLHWLAGFGFRAHLLLAAQSREALRTSGRASQILSWSHLGWARLGQGSLSPHCHLRPVPCGSWGSSHHFIGLSLTFLLRF